MIKTWQTRHSLCTSRANLQIGPVTTPLLRTLGPCNTPKKKKKKRIKKEGYLSKIVYGVNFIINVSKGFLENKVETLAIYIRLLYQCI